MLLLHPVQTSTDAGPDLCTLCPDLCTLCLWWCNPSTRTVGGCHQLQFALVVLFHPANGANTALALGNLHCVVVVCVVVVINVGVEVYMKTALALQQLALCGGI